jgi:hypothetical protein
MTTPLQPQGSLADTNCCEVLGSLCGGAQTGVLTAQGPGGEKSIYLEKGRIVFAASKDPDDRLGELLLTRGAVTREQLDQASAKVRPGKRLGTILVELGFLPAAELPRWVLEQVKEIIYSLFSWGDGKYRFEAGPFPSGEVIALRISTAEIFLSGLRRVQKWSVVKKGAGETQIAYRLSSNFRELLKEAHLGKEEESLLELLAAGEQTMEEAARQSSLTTLLVYQLFFAFRVLGVVLPGQAPAQGQEPPLPKAFSPSSNAGAGEASPAADPPKDSLAGAESRSRVAPGPRSDADLGAHTVVLKMPLIPAVAAAPDKKPAQAAPETTAAPPALEGTPIQGSSEKTPAAAPPEKSPSAAPTSRKREYRVVRVEGDRLDGKGVQQIEEVLGTWSRKGYSLAGVVQGRGSGLFNSTPPSFFIFERD